MVNMMDLFGKLREVQTKMKEAQEKLSQIRVEGESGAGMVKAIVNGQKQLLELEIDDDLVATIVVDNAYFFTWHDQDFSTPWI